MIGLSPAIAQIGPVWLSTWLTPVWILGVGALLGLLILLVLWLLSSLVSRRWAFTVPEMVGEGVLMPIFITTAVFALFGIFGAALVQSPLDIVSSVPRFLATGEQVLQQPIEVTPLDGFVQIPLQYSVFGEELSLFRVESEDQSIFISEVTEDQNTDDMIEVGPGNPYEWRRAKDALSPIGDTEVSALSVANIGTGPANINVTVSTQPKFPQSLAIVMTALSVVGVFLLYFLQQLFFPKMSAIAFSTAKSEMAQPMFAIVLALGAFLLFVFVYIPYNTFGEDIKMLKDSGFTTIMILAIIQAVWGASNSVADEIEGKTALTVLSKPVSRRQFVFGKFVGISWTALVIFIVLGAFFMILVAYKPVYDARESSKLPPIWEESYIEVIRTIPGLVLAFFETVVLTAVSVAISTRLPLLANFAICFAIYALGHLTPLLVQSAVGSLPPVAFMGLFISAVLPMLEAFNIQAAVAAGLPVSFSYLGMAFVYCCLYSLVAMLLALILFEDRDLA